MTVTYPVEVQREVDRRWAHLRAALRRPLDRPKHANDIRPLPKAPLKRARRFGKPHGP